MIGVIPQIYHGSAPPETHEVIAQHSTLGDGVCLNVYDGFDKIEASLKRIGRLGIKLFLDNGSFERFGKFNNGVITEEQYASPSAVSAYFKRVTKEYEATVAASAAPANLILTVPEVVGNATVTAEMQARFMPEYLALARDSGVSLITAWQFPPKALDWHDQAIAAARAIVRQDPGRVARVGIPFGKEFARYQNPRDWKLIEAMFGTGIFTGRKAHMFGLGSPMKHAKFAKGRPWIVSVDASTINKLSTWASYMSRSGFVLDIRDLKGERGADRQEGSLAVFKADGMALGKWRAMSMAERFRVNLENFDHVIEHVYKGTGRPRSASVSDLLSFAEEAKGQVKAMAVPVPWQAGHASATAPPRLRDRPDAYFKTLPDGLVLNFAAVRARLRRERLRVVSMAEEYSTSDYVLSFDVEPAIEARVAAVVGDIDRWLGLARVRPSNDIRVLHTIAPREHAGHVEIRVRGGIGWLHDVETRDDP
jgi:hypothetical protein